MYMTERTKSLLYALALGAMIRSCSGRNPEGPPAEKVRRGESQLANAR